MSLPLLIHGLGSMGLFASRAFLPAFATSLLLRFGPQVPWIAKTGLLGHVRGVPTWFTSDSTLIILGLLAVLEFVAQRVPEARVILETMHRSLKVGMATLTFLGVLSVTDLTVIGGITGDWNSPAYLSALTVGAGTYLASRVRGAVFDPLSEMDEDDDLGLQGLVRWVEDLWGVLGPVALVVFPILTLSAFGLAVFLLVLVERRIERLGESATV
ncbi:MAG TPA: hypothetical protein VFT74_21715, partial [Isosphaeraceae bacterium]|nr:hypothetical protein [Isosphaeraceae bacterium]